MAYLILVIVLLATFGFGVMSAAGVKGFVYMVNVPSLILVILPALIATLLSKSAKDVNPLAVLFSSRETIDREKAVGAYHFFRTFGHAFVVMGFIAFFTSFILLLRGMPDPRSFGPPFAIGLVSLLYALFWKVVAYSAEQHILQKADLRGELVSLDSKEWSVYLCAILPMAYWAILVIFMSK